MTFLTSHFHRLPTLAGLILLAAAPLLAAPGLYTFTLPSIDGESIPLSTY